MVTSIEFGLQNSRALPVEINRYSQALNEVRASFVTLEINQQLRGCIGQLNACKPLVKDVADNAFSAAFSDPRFPPLSIEEFPTLDIHVSVLSAAEPVNVESEQALLNELRPHIDGLIISDGYYRATFLPSVWETLPEKQQFLTQLKLKAGLTANYWSDTLRVERYTTFAFGAPVAEIES